MKKIAILLLFTTMALTVRAQQDALYSQYMFNQLVINPAYAGCRDVLSLTAVNRHQWVGIDGAPKTLSVTLDSPLRNEKIGLGLYVYRDKLGPVEDVGAMANYSYRIRMGRGKLSFGLQVGVKHKDINWAEVEVEETSDVFYYGNERTRLLPDANFGVYYYTNRYYFGLSSKHLMQKEFSYHREDGQSVYGKLLRHFYGMAGVAIPMTDHITFRPSTLIKYVANAPMQVDVNASFLFNDVFWVGASYRTQRALVLITEICLSEKLRLGYSYDFYMNELEGYNRGSHEIMLRYDINWDGRMLTPRYF